MRLYNNIDIPEIGMGPGLFGQHPNAKPVLSQPSISIPRWNIPLRAWNKYIARPYRNMRDAKMRAAAIEHYKDAVVASIRIGFRLIDFSTAYGNGTLISDAIARSGVSREDIFLTGRISNHAQFQGPSAVSEQIKCHLEEYRTDYVDVLMFHWPVTGHYQETWKEICKAYESGLCRSIGVANCHPHHIAELMKVGLKPMINQFEVHPLFTQKDLIKYNQDLGIVVESYTPIARYDDRLMRLPRLRMIAESHHKTPVQVVLRWHIQQGLIPVIRSQNPIRQREDFDVFDFELSQEEMKIIDSFNINSRLRYDPDNCDFTIL